MGAWPDVDSFADWAGIKDGIDDGRIEAALAAVQAAIVSRCPTLADVDDIPPDVVYASLLWARRLLARRNSPEGVVGVGEMGVATVARYDPDIGRLLGPYTPPVLA